MDKKAVLTINEIKTLRGIIGQDVTTINSNTMSYNLNNHSFDIFEPVVIGVGKEYLSIGCEEVENDYCRLIIQKQSHPDPLEYEANEYFNLVYKNPISSIDIWSNVKKITILTPDEKIDSSSRLTGILIHLENKKIIGLTAVFPFGPRIIFNTDDINNLISNSVHICDIDDSVSILKYERL
ncbi:hypothetical protein ACOI1C_11040 [Bacillus sp. DJP31]|uniref:hypothetical protein n=1 Tax=Bacillus sp. DJP31 TaxID=3409789 RepID=UPI003BB5DD79